MTIEILYVPGCPNFQPAWDAVSALLAADSLRAEVRRIPVLTDAQAEALQFPGSPTIRVNGRDVQTSPSSPVALACRIYPGGQGVPSTDAIRAAISEALGTSESIARG